MLGSRKELSRGLLMACSAALFCLSGCGGPQFTSSDAGGTGSNGGSTATGGKAGGGSGGASEVGGTSAAGDTASSGAPPTGGAGGSGGTVSSGCDCPAGSYCRDGSTDCFSCAELSRLHFSTPERLAALSEGGFGARFPRTAASGTDLVYRSVGTGLRYTTDASTSAGNGVDATLPQDSGPLWLNQPVTSVTGTIELMSFNFLFDRLEGPRRRLFFGEWKDGLGMVEKAPTPYDGGKNDFSVAVAHHATPDNIPRAFWMSDRDLAVGGAGTNLLTAQFVSNAVVLPVKLDIGQKSCSPQMANEKVDQDLTPWVTEDGKTLLISVSRVDSGCLPEGQGKDIYTALLQPTTGQPTAAAVPMNDVNSSSNEVDPSFSADLCDLYFASDRDGKYAIYRAHRR